jgi:hypothetical protein
MKEECVITKHGFVRQVDNKTVTTVQFNPSGGLQIDNDAVVLTEDLLTQTLISVHLVRFNSHSLQYEALNASAVLSTGDLVLVVRVTDAIEDVNYHQRALASPNRFTTVDTQHIARVGLRRFLSPSETKVVPNIPSPLVLSVHGTGERIVLTSDSNSHATTFQVHDCVAVTSYSIDKVVHTTADISALLDNLRVFLPKPIGNLSAGLYTSTRSGGVTSLVSIPSHESPRDVLIHQYTDHGLQSVYRILPSGGASWSDPTSFAVLHVYEFETVIQGVWYDGQLGKNSRTTQVPGLQRAVASSFSNPNPLNTIAQAVSCTLADLVHTSLLIPGSGVCDVTVDSGDATAIQVTLRIPDRVLRHCNVSKASEGEIVSVESGGLLTRIGSTWTHKTAQSTSLVTKRPHFTLASPPDGQQNLVVQVNVQLGTYVVKSLDLYAPLVSRFCPKFSPTMYSVLYAYTPSGTTDIRVGECVFDATTNKFTQFNDLQIQPYVSPTNQHMQVENLPVLTTQNEMRHLVIVPTTAGWTTVPSIVNSRVVQFTTHVEGFSEQSTSTTTGALTVNGGIGVQGDVHCENLFALSDGNKKYHIKPLSRRSSLKAVRRLNPCMYKLAGSDSVSSGLIAQQLQPVIPHSVKAAPSGELSVNYQSVIAHLIGAVQKLATKKRTRKSKRIK